MNNQSEDRIPLTQSSSKIKQESGVLVQPRIFKSSLFDKGDQQLDAPKPPPRTKSSNKVKKYFAKEEDNDNLGDASSEDSTRTITIHHRVVSAEVHSSRTRLLSSSEEDMVTVKSKMSVLKSSKGRKSHRTNKATKNTTESSVDSETDTRTAAFVHKTLKIGNDRMSEGNEKQNDVINFPSQRRLSGGSYTLEKPTFPLKSHQVENNETPTLPIIKTPVPLPRRKKSKENKLQENDNVVVKSEVTEVTTKEEVMNFNYKSDTVLDGRPHRKKKKRKHYMKKEHQLMSDSDQNGIETVEMSVFKHSTEQHQEVLTTESQMQTPAISKIALDEKITGITIHCSDCLIPDELVSHPMVRVHIVDMTTGEYLKKSDPKRPLTYQEENTEYILPMMTHPYDFREHRSVIPQWKELLVFNEKIEHIATASTLLLFEIVDFVDFVTASSRYNNLGSDGAWHCVAWAFLKLFGANGACNLDKELRLQLYKPRKTKKNLKTSVYSPIVYDWWCTGCDKYRGTMYVTVAAITASDLCLTLSLRSSVVLQKEESCTSSIVGSDTVVQSPKQQDTSFQGFKEIQEESEQEPEPEPVVWSRLPSQSCKLPNKQMCTLPAGTAGGSMALQFSYSGLFLASGTTAGNILVYTVPYWKLFVTLHNHQGLIYCVHWSKDDKFLISASADSTVCIWIIKQKKSAPIHVLPHPSFVYCADFVHNVSAHSEVTGCYDGVLRLWSEQKLVYEARGHSGFITALCFSMDGGVMISGDSVGVAIMWKISDNCIVKLNTIAVRELKGTIINNLVAHPGGNRLLVHSRDSLLRMVDIATGVVIQWFQGCVNERLQTGCCLTPCGGMVLACSEDGTLCVWDSNTSTQLAMYMSLFPAGCGAVHYHPHEHIAAVSSYAPGSYAQIVLIGYDRSAAGKDIGLKIMESSMSLGALGIKEAQGTTVSDIRKLFGGSEKSQKNVFTVSNISNISTPNIDSDVAVRNKKKSSKSKGLPQHRKSKPHAVAAENVYNTNDVLSSSSDRHAASKARMLTDNDDDDSTSIQTVKNMKIDSTAEGVEDKRLRDIIRRMDRVLLAAIPSNKST